MHDITIFRGGEKEVEEANWDHKAVYFKLKDGERMIGDSGYNGEPNKLSVWKDEHAKGLKKFIGRVCARQETFLRVLRIGRFFETVLLTERQLRRGWNCIRWWLRQLLLFVNMTMKTAILHLKYVR